MQYAICTSYTTYDVSIIELPDGRTWEDVANSFIKWGTLHITFKGDLGGVSIDLKEAWDLDTKRPVITEIRATKVEGDETVVDWGLDPIAVDN
jgi:hypothetical protein